jgi:two-component system LytT family response regulator
MAVMDDFARIPSHSAAAWRLPLKCGSRTVVVDVRAIDWVQAAGNYVIFHVGGERHMVRLTLGGLERALQGSDFVRIHKSALVNLARVRTIEPLQAGDQHLTLADGTRLVLSRTFRAQVERTLACALLYA